MVKTLSSAAVDTASKGQVKALLQRKQRAWSDMLKELRRVGVPLRLKHNLLESQRRREWLFDQPGLHTQCSSPVLAELASSIDSVYVGLIGSMTSLRDAFSGHHSDIPTRELERATSVVEVTFRFGIESRTR